MALTGPLILKGILAPEAHVQIFQFQVTVGMEISGMAYIYANAEQAKDVRNHIESVIVVSIDDQVTDYRQQLYNELQLDSNFSHLTVTDEIFEITSNRMERALMRLPLGRYSPEVGHEVFATD